MGIGMLPRPRAIGLLLASAVGGACLCGREIEGFGDGGLDAGHDGGMVLDAGDAGQDAGDAGEDAGYDAGIDCSMTCQLGNKTYCANQIVPGACLVCHPDVHVDGGFDRQPEGTRCENLLSSGPYPPYNKFGACYINPQDIEYCSCGVNGSTCFWATDCCWGICVDAGAHAFCYGDRGPCPFSAVCLSGVCCLPDDGGLGSCADDAGVCP